MPGLTFQDIYGNVGVMSEEPQLEAASGGELIVGTAPTVSWLGIILLLVAWRVVIELAEEV